MALSPLLGMFETMVPGMFETLRRREGVSPPTGRTTRVVVRAYGGAMPSCTSKHGLWSWMVSDGRFDCAVPAAREFAGSEQMKREEHERPH